MQWWVWAFFFLWEVIKLLIKSLVIGPIKMSTFFSVTSSSLCISSNFSISSRLSHLLTCNLQLVLLYNPVYCCMISSDVFISWFDYSLVLYLRFVFVSAFCILSFISLAKGLSVYWFFQENTFFFLKTLLYYLILFNAFLLSVSFNFTLMFIIFSICLFWI